MVIVDQEEWKGEAVHRLTALRILTDTRGRVLLNEEGLPRFEESFLTRYFINGERNGRRASRKARSSEEAHAAGIRMKETGYDNVVIIDREVSDTLQVMDFGKPVSEYHDRTAGKLFGAMWERLQAEGKLLEDESTATVAKYLASSILLNEQEVITVPSVYRTEAGTFIPIRANGMVSAIRDRCVRVMASGPETRSYFPPKGWDIIVKEGQQLHGGQMFAPSKNDKLLTRQAYRARGIAALRLKVVCECGTENVWSTSEDSVDLCLSPSMCDCGQAVNPAVDCRIRIDKKALYVELEYDEDTGKVVGLPIQHPAAVSHWDKLTGVINNSMAVQCAVIQGAERRDIMQRAGRKNRVEALFLIT